MTAQISDTVNFQKRVYNVAGIAGEGLFDPIEHGVEPVASSTACWRGYHCSYEISDGILLLRSVNLGLSEQDQATLHEGKPTLFDRVPRRYKIHGESWDLATNEVRTSWESHDFVVNELRQPIDFTGGLLLGDKFVRELYVHMEFHPAWKYRRVHEIVFQQGRVVSATDKSDEMASLRVMLADEPYGPKDPKKRSEIRAWIDRCFSLDYSSDRVPKTTHRTAPAIDSAQLRAPTEYNDDYEMFHFIQNHCRDLFTSVELKANGGPRDSEAKSLLVDGIDAFRHRVCERIRANPEAASKISRCRKCRRVLRTPLAKQCFHCGDSWRSK